MKLKALTELAIKKQLQDQIKKLKKLATKDDSLKVDQLLKDIIEVSFNTGFTEGSNSQINKVTELKKELQKLLKLGGQKNGYTPKPEEVYKKGHYAGD